MGKYTARITIGVISPMIMFGGGSGVSNVQSADSIIIVRIGSVGYRSSGHPRTSANVCCRYGRLVGWICSPFIVRGGPPRCHLHPQFLFHPVSIRRCGNVC
jgi:hypothetical protein